MCPRKTANFLLIGLAALAVFHVLLIVGVLPADIAWGGRADRSAPSFFLLEIIGLLMITLFAAVVAAKAGYLKLPGPRRIVDVGVWLVGAYFALNTVGNLASLSGLERAIFTPVSLVLSVLAFCLARAPA